MRASGLGRLTKVGTVWTLVRAQAVLSHRPIRHVRVVQYGGRRVQDYSWFAKDEIYPQMDSYQDRMQLLMLLQIGRCRTK